MTSPASPDATSTAPTSTAPTTLRGVLAIALRQIVIVTIAVVVIGVAVGALTAGLPGVWGALLGGVVGIVFCLTTVVTMLRSEGRSPQYLAALVLGGWLAKMLIIIVMLAVLQNMTFYNKYVLAATLVVIVLASLVTEVRAVLSARITVVETPSPVVPGADTEL